MLRNNGFLKPNPYVEILVDGKSVRKTETLKNTAHPRWEQELTVLVTPVSVLQFRVLDHSSFRKDNILGERTVSVAELLQKHSETRPEIYILYMYLNKATTASTGGAAEEDVLSGERTTSSEMLVMVKGLAKMECDTGVGGVGGSSLVTVNGVGLCVSPNASSGPSNGDAVRIRGRNSGGASEVEFVAGGAYGASNHATSSSTGAVAASKRNSGLNWSNEANNRGDSALIQRAMTVQVSRYQLSDYCDQFLVRTKRQSK